MGKKYVTFSFDDGLIQDRRVVALMREYGLKGTFNLNAGLFGAAGEVKGIGTFAFQDLPRGTPHIPLFTYVPHDRLSGTEVLRLYDGMEIADHGYCHEFLARLPTDQMHRSIDSNITALETLTGRKIVGHAYPNGMAARQVSAYLKEKGVIYARTAISSGCFAFPQDPWNYHPSGKIAEKKAIVLIRRFRQMQTEEDLLLYLWGHSYEFDYGTEYHNWDYLKRVFEAASQCTDCIFCTNAEAFQRI